MLLNFKVILLQIYIFYYNLIFNIYNYKSKIKFKVIKLNNYKVFYKLIDA